MQANPNPMNLFSTGVPPCPYDARMADIFTTAELDKILRHGKLEYEWSDLGSKVVFHLFPMEAHEQIQYKVSGLDFLSRRLVVDIYELAYSIHSIGGYTFQGNSMEEKLKFVRGMSKPIFDLFIQQLRYAQGRQLETFQKIQDDLKNYQPAQL